MTTLATVLGAAPNVSFKQQEPRNQWVLAGFVVFISFNVVRHSSDVHFTFQKEKPSECEKKLSKWKQLEKSILIVVR